MRPVRMRLVGTAFALAALALAGCGRGADTVWELTGSAMGTTYSVKLAQPERGLDLERLKADIETTLETLEQSMSTWRADSELSLFNRAVTTDWFDVSARLCSVVSSAQAMSRLTDGAFDVTVGPLVNLWGFGPDGMRDEPPPAERVDALSRAVGFERLHTDCERPALRKDVSALYVDLSAFAKGYAVDELGHLLESLSVTNYLVEVGGELRLRGVNGAGVPWAIAIETPARTARSVQTVVRLTDTCLATSGDYRNYFEHGGTFYSHTIDPRSGRPVAHSAASVTVLADEAASADALATALLVMGPDDGAAFAERHDIAALFVLRTEDGYTERQSARFRAEVAGG